MVSKGAKAEARAKSKTAVGKTEPSKTEANPLAAKFKPAEPAKPEPPKIASLCDDPAPLPAHAESTEPKEVPGSYAQFAEVDDDDGEPVEYGDLDEVA